MNKYLFTIDENYVNYRQLTKHLNSLKENDLKNNYQIRTFNDTLKEIKQIEKNDLNNYDKIVIINDDGIYPFMYFSKIKGLVAASIYDEHSAYMTPFHNDTKILCSGYEICSWQLLLRIVYLFLQTKFEGGRHYARIDMLTKMLEEN